MARDIWGLVADQHGVVARRQLLALGLHPQGIKHRLASGRLHRVHRGVYVVGRPELSRRGAFMAAVLAAGEGAVLSHFSAAELSRIWPLHPGPIEVSVARTADTEHPGLVVHRRRPVLLADARVRERIPLTSPVQTIVDLAGRLSRSRLERVIVDADKLDLVDPDELRSAIDRRPRCPGTGVLRRVLDRHAFVLTDSELERLFVPIARRVGLSTPRTGAMVNGFKVDFSWPDLGLVIETDGLRYHRSPAQQAVDRDRDQVHTAAGLTTLRFTHWQVRHRPRVVESRLRAVVERLRAR